MIHFSYFVSFGKNKAAAAASAADKLHTNNCPFSFCTCCPVCLRCCLFMCSLSCCFQQWTFTFHKNGCLIQTRATFISADFDCLNTFCKPFTKKLIFVTTSCATKTILALDATVHLLLNYFLYQGHI